MSITRENKWDHHIGYVGCLGERRPLKHRHNCLGNDERIIHSFHSSLGAYHVRDNNKGYK